MAKKTTDAPATGPETKEEIGAPIEAQRSGFDGERKKETADMEHSPQGGSGMERASSDAAGTCESGFYIYIGPNIKKYIQTGTIYRGTRANALKQAAEAIKAYPLVRTLIVSGDALPEARIKVKTPGNVLYANYRKLAGKEGK